MEALQLSGAIIRVKKILINYLCIKRKKTLARWLASKRDVCTLGAIQNEFLHLISRSIVTDIADKIRSLPHLQFSIMMGGTRDQSGTEQEALCLRYADHDLVVHEEFIGLY